MENFHPHISPDPISDDIRPGWTLVKDVIQTLLLSAILFFGINFVSARIRVESVSMQQTLNPGDFVIVNRLAYIQNGPARGDVIVFDPPVPTDEPYIKRVIGLPGDEIEITSGQVYINGFPLVEPYLKDAVLSSGRWLVPENAIFVMGDNRNNSTDSRRWGMVPLENLIGKAVFVYWPPDQWGALMPGAAAAETP